MKKRITVFVALMMVLCLALTGCGQNTDKQEANRPGENFDTGDSSIMDGTNNPDGYASEHEAIANTNDESIPDGAAEEAARNEEQSNSDGYSYNVAGHTLTCRTKIEDYIGEGGDGVFMFNDLAKDLGWHARNPEDEGKPDLMRYVYGEDNECEVGFDSPSGTLYFQINSVNLETHATAHFTFSKEGIEAARQLYYVNYGGTQKINYDQIVIITYLLENIKENPDKNFLRDVFYFTNNSVCYLYE